MVLAPGPEGRVVSSGDRLIVLRALKAGMKDLRDGQWIGAVAASRDDESNPLMDECDEDMCHQFSVWG